MIELASGVGGGELPMDLDLLFVAACVPRGHFGGQRFQIWNALAEALPARRGEFDLRQIEPDFVFEVYESPACR